MIAQFFDFVVKVLGETGVEAETVSIVEKVFDFIVSLFIK